MNFEGARGWLVGEAKDGIRTMFTMMNETLKTQMTRIGPVATFENLVVNVPEGVCIDDYYAVIIWCESLDQFITAAQYC